MLFCSRTGAVVGLALLLPLGWGCHLAASLDDLQVHPAASGAGGSGGSAGSSSTGGGDGGAPCDASAVYEAEADAWLDQSDPTATHGLEDILIVDGAARIIIRFDSLPDGPIGDAQLCLTAAVGGVPGVVSIFVHGMPSLWNEDQVTWDSRGGPVGSWIGGTLNGDLGLIIDQRAISPGDTEICFDVADHLRGEVGLLPSFLLTAPSLPGAAFVSKDDLGAPGPELRVSGCLP